jgi:hypothetical protein
LKHARDKYGSVTKKVTHTKCKELIPKIINDIRLVKLGGKVSPHIIPKKSLAPNVMHENISS